MTPQPSTIQWRAERGGGTGDGPRHQPDLYLEVSIYEKFITERQIWVMQWGYLRNFIGVGWGHPQVSSRHWHYLHWYGVAGLSFFIFEFRSERDKQVWYWSMTSVDSTGVKQSLNCSKDDCSWVRINNTNYCKMWQWIRNRKIYISKQVFKSELTRKTHYNGNEREISELKAQQLHPNTTQLIR